VGITLSLHAVAVAHERASSTEQAVKRQQPAVIVQRGETLVGRSLLRRTATQLTGHGRHAARAGPGSRGGAVSLVWWWSTLPIPIGPVRRGGRARAPAAMSPDSGRGPPSPTSRLAPPPQHKQRQIRAQQATPTPDRCPATRRRANRTRQSTSSSSSIAARRSSYRPRNCSPRKYIYSLQNKKKRESREIVQVKERWSFDSEEYSLIIIIHNVE
jgi:hypothetical protein